MAKPVTIQSVLEVRYERGYRYLDKCGEAMLILQEVLPAESKAVWMPEDISPSGAKLKCPDLDLRLVFDSARFYMETSFSDVTPLFPSIAATAFAVISGRFDIRSIVRVGSRRIFIVGTDSTEEADALSLKLSPFHDWPPACPENFLPRSNDLTTSYETQQDSKGFTFSFRSVSRPGAPEQMDERLNLPSRLLEKGQKEALLDQIKRRSKREKDPISGLLLDLDYYHVRPARAEIAEFWKTAVAIGDKIIQATLVRL